MRLVLAQIAAAVYSIESMLYMTAGIIDLYDNTDIDMETAAIKVNDYHLIEIFNE